MGIFGQNKHWTGQSSPFWRDCFVLNHPWKCNFLSISSSSKLSHWVSRIKESSSSGRWQEVFFHYSEMNKAGVQVTETSILHPILKACSIISFRNGKSLHASIIKLGFESCISTGNSIMDFYVKSGVMGPALGVFGCMKIRDSVSWNIIIRGLFDHGDLDGGLWSFVQGRVAGFEPNISTLVLVIQASRNLRASHDGPKMHGYIIRSGFLAISSVQNSLLHMYADIGMEFAQKLFDEMCERDVISWSVLIGGYVKSEEAHIALHLLGEMFSKVGIEADGQTMVSALKACTYLQDLDMGRSFHGFVICKGFGYDLFVANSLVDMYSKFRDPDSALKIFREMPQRNIVSWNSLLSGFVHNKKYSEALLLFDSMQKAGIEAVAVTLVNLLQVCKYFENPLQCKCIHSMIVRQNYDSNELVISTLIDVYAKCDLICLAWKLFRRMKKRDTIAWSTMIASFTNCGLPDQAIGVFQEMNQASQEKPNVITILNLIETCSYYPELKRPKWAHGIAIRRGLASEVMVGTALLNMYARCGEIVASRKVFDQISNKNIVSWSSMITAYGMNGLARDALALLAEMEMHGLRPNSITILSVLSACSHGGLIKEGLSFFQHLVDDQEVELGLEHYSCLVDLLSRGGKLDFAMEVFDKMPEGMKAGASAWGALLSACKRHGNEEIGEEAVSRVLELDPHNSAGYMLASSMYAAGGSWEDAARMRGLAKEKRVKVVAGYSMVHVNNKAFRFVAGDKNQILSDEICLVIEELHECMKTDKRIDEVNYGD